MKDGLKDSGTEVEKGFDDSELADIMSEIENLEKEYSSDITSSDEKLEIVSASNDNITENIEKTEISEDIDFSKGLDDLKLLEEDFSGDLEVSASSDLGASPQPVLSHESLELPEKSQSVAKLENNFTQHTALKEQNDDSTVRTLRSIQMEPVVKSKNLDVDKNIEQESHHLKSDFQTFNQVQTHKSTHSSPSQSTQSKSQSQTTTSLNFHIEGSMKMDLGFQINNEKINLVIDQDGLKIQLSSGMSFHLPLKKAS